MAARPGVSELWFLLSLTCLGLLFCKLDIAIAQNREKISFYWNSSNPASPPAHHSPRSPSVVTMGTHVRVSTPARSSDQFFLSTQTVQLVFYSPPGCHTSMAAGDIRDRLVFDGSDHDSESLCSSFEWT
ncbi:hypothetical protein RRG08_014607 [Elysia crispata]|uniref:Uncharacterized protein n=1 Tax=Elysia crispata TaxID=231223 RepID=A0AAE0YRR3_9GAST|nr:hypothetical protein RRG08_014607 [Elysia crispata]